MDYNQKCSELLNELYFDWIRSGYNLENLREDFLKLVCKNYNNVNNYHVIQEHLRRKTVDLTPQIAIDYNNIDITYILQENPTLFQSVDKRNKKLSSDVLNIFFANGKGKTFVEINKTQKQSTYPNQIKTNNYNEVNEIPPSNNQSMNNSKKFCSFCKKNGEPFQMYTSHQLYCPITRKRCPVLQSCVCSYCKENGHTIAHCKKNKNRDSVLKMLTKFNSMDINEGEPSYSNINF